MHGIDTGYAWYTHRLRKTKLRLCCGYATLPPIPKRSTKVPYNEVEDMVIY